MRDGCDPVALTQAGKELPAAETQSSLYENPTGSQSRQILCPFYLKTPGAMTAVLA